MSALLHDALMRCLAAYATDAIALILRDFNEPKNAMRVISAEAR